MQIKFQHKLFIPCVYLLCVVWQLFQLKPVKAQNNYNWNWIDTFNQNSIIATPNHFIKTADNNYLLSYYQIHDGGNLARNYYFKISLVNTAGVATKTITIRRDSFYDVTFNNSGFTDVAETDSFYLFTSAIKQSTGKPCLIYVVIDKQFTGYRIGDIQYSALPDSFEYAPSELTVKFNKYTNQFYGVNRLWSTNKPKPYHIYQVNILLDERLKVLNNTVSITSSGIGSKQDVVYSPSTKRYYSIELFNDSIVLDSMMNTISVRNTSFLGIHDMYQTNDQVGMSQSFIEYNQQFILSGIWYKYFGPLPVDPFSDHYHNYYYLFKRLNQTMQLVDSVSIFPIPEDSTWSIVNSNLSEAMIPAQTTPVSFHNPNHIYFSYFSYTRQSFDSSWYVIGVLDSLLKLKWAKKFYHHNSRINVKSILATEDGGCLVLGNNTHNSRNYLYEIDMFIAKHEADGRLTSINYIKQDTRQPLVYPNPAKDFITVSGLRAPVRAVVVNLYGQNTALPVNDFCIDVSVLSNGVYILQMFDSTGDLISSQKIIKQ